MDRQEALIKLQLAVTALKDVNDNYIDELGGDELTPLDMTLAVAYSQTLCAYTMTSASDKDEYVLALINSKKRIQALWEEMKNRTREKV